MSGAANIIITQLDGAAHMVFLRMFEHRFCTLGISCGGFYFQQGALARVSHHKVDLQAGILMEIIELPAHLCQDIGSEVFKNGSFVAVQIALQHIELCAVFQHGDQQATVHHIDLKNILNGVPVQGQFRQRQIVAAANNARVLDPLQAAGKFGRGSAFFTTEY